MKIPAAIVLIILAAIAGYLAADGMAYNMAKKHGVRKYGGLFTLQPDTAQPVNKADAAK